MGLFSSFADNLHKKAKEIDNRKSEIDKLSIEELAYEIERYGFTSEYHSSMYRRLNNSTENISNLVSYLINNGYECKRCTNRYYKFFQDAGFFCKQDKRGIYHLDSSQII
ncbi:MAG: hypothetical protein ACI4WH_02545 [Oscillospiraceae bacterium]